MKKKSTKALSIFMAILFVASVFDCLVYAGAGIGFTASAVNKTESVSGDGWTLYSDGELIITKNITPDEDGDFPWKDNASKVKSVTLFGDKVTTVADGTFTGTNIEVLYIPSSITSITNHAFDDENGNMISSLKTIYYQGKSSEFDDLNSGIESTSVKVVYYHEHKEVVKNIVLANCEKRQNGYSGDTYCSVCFALIKEGSKESYSNAHKWSDKKSVRVVATCATNVDIYASKCTICGAWKNDDEPKENKKAHTFSIVQKKSDYECGSEGAMYTAKCKVCGYEELKATPNQHDYLETNTPATCVTDGKITKTCKYCNTDPIVTNVPRLGHKNTANKTITTATCTEPGEMITYCTICNEKLSSTFVKATGHKFGDDWTVVKKPNCKESGLKAKECVNAGCKYYVEAEAITINIHSKEYIKYYETDWKIEKATCNNEGLKTLVCKACGESIIDENGNETTEIIPIDKSTHKAGDWIIKNDATCVSDGYKIKECEYCGKELNRETIPATGHEYEFTTTVSCVEGGGTAIKTCKKCADEQEVKVAAAEKHSIEIVVTPPTCTKIGYTEQKCTVEGCGFVSGKFEEQAALGHDIDSSEWSTVNPANCTESGLKERKCVRFDECGYKVEEIIPASGHKTEHRVIDSTCIKEGKEYDICLNCNEETDVVVLPTVGHNMFPTVVEPKCTERGYTVYKCSVCETSYPDDYKEALGHDMDEGTVVAATCTKDGYIEKKCKRGCGYKVVDSATDDKAKGHTAEIDASVEPTCTETGLAEGSHCSVCGYVLIPQAEIPAKGHTNMPLPAKEPTCTETGLTEGKHCIVCNTVTLKQSEIEAKGHTCETKPGVAATCTKTGLTEGSVCTVCGETIAEQTVIPVKDHTIAIDKYVAATCEKDGKKQGSHCSVCGKVIVKQEVIKATGHNIVSDKAVAASCEKDGKKQGSHCSVCGKVIVKQEVVKATGHNYVHYSTKKEATAFTSGIEVLKCTICNKTVEQKYSLTFMQRITWIFNSIILSINSAFDAVNKILSGVKDNLS